MDLIDRQALLKQIEIDSDGEPGYYGDTWKFIDTIKRMPSALGTNLAEVGTDVHDINVGNKAQLSDKGTTFENGGEIKRWSKDIISRQAAIEALSSSEFPNSSDTDTISRQAAIEAMGKATWAKERLAELPPAEPKRGKWILDRSGAYCCSECMEPCATYVMMQPRDKYCKMCGSRNEVTT